MIAIQKKITTDKINQIQKSENRANKNLREELTLMRKAPEGDSPS